MKPLQRTSWWIVILFVAIGFGVGYTAEVALSASGNAPLVPPFSLPATLLTVSLILLGFALSLRRSITGANKKQVNPFTAVRVVAAAKASILSGALFAGFSLGILLYFGMRTVPPQAGSWWPVIATAIASIIQLAIGVLSEYLCRVPPTDSDEPNSTDADASHVEPDAPGAVTAHRNNRAAR
jgi:hypothetical protein